MEQSVLLEYVNTKNVIYQLHPVLAKLSDTDLECVFQSFGHLNQVALNTYLFPYDQDLFNDIKNLKIDDLFDNHIQEKYHIDDSLLLSKYNEYQFFQFGSLLDNIDMGKIDYQKTIVKKN